MSRTSDLDNIDRKIDDTKSSEFYLLFQNRLPRWLSHDIPPLRATIKWLVQKSPSGELSVKILFDGIEAVTRGLYPLLFLGSWGYDHYNYRMNSQNRYQMSLEDLWLGLPKNYHYENVAFASNLGGDIASITRWNYWPWTLIVSSALLSGILFTAASRQRQTPIFYQIDPEEFRSFCMQFNKDFIHSFPYLTTYYWQLYRWKNRLIQKRYRDEQKENPSLDIKGLNHRIQEDCEPLLKQNNKFRDIVAIHTDSDLDIDTRQELEKILISVEYRSYFARYLAIQALADIAYWRPHDKMGEFAAKKLTDIANRNPYIHYQLWSSGHSKNVIAHLMGYFLVIPMQLFIHLRLWTLLVTKIMGLMRFLQDQQQCWSDGKIWTYSTVGQYVCTPCDWVFVDYRPRGNYTLQGQDCVDALMSSARSADEIYSKLSSVQNNGPLTTLDFSRQNWTVWPEQDWQNVIGLLNTSFFSSVSTLNLSRPIPDVLPIPSYYLEILADYLPFTSIHCLDLGGLQLTANNTMQFIAALYNNSFIQYLGFSRSGLTDQVLYPLLEFLPGMISLRSLMLAGNQLTGLTLNLLGNVSQSLNHLDLSYNGLTAADIDRFHLNSTALQTLQLSGVDLGIGSLNNFIFSLSNSSLRNLIMDYCGIGDSLAISLFAGITSSPLQTLNWAGNRIGYQGLKMIADMFNVSSLMSFNLNDNMIDDLALSILASALTANRSLQSLMLAGNPFGISGFKNLAASLGGSSLSSLSVSRVKLGDSAADVLSELPSNHFTLTQLDLSRTGLTSAGAAVLLPYLANTSLTDLDLHGNSFLSEISIPLQTSLNGTTLKNLNLRATGISAQSLISAWPSLTNSSLQELDISENNLGESSAVVLAEYLLPLKPNLTKILKSFVENVDGERVISRASASPATSLQKLTWESDDSLTNLAGHALCLVIPGTNIANTNLSIGGGQLNPTASGISGCPLTMGEAKFNAGSIHSPSASWLFLILLVGLSSQNSSNSSLFLAGLGAVFFGMIGGIPGILLGAVAGYRVNRWLNPSSSNFSLFSYSSSHVRSSQNQSSSNSSTFQLR